MKKLLLISMLSYTTTFAVDTNSTKPFSVKQEGLIYIKILGTSLKQELQTQMMADKTGIKALEFCTKKANEITETVNKQLPNYAKVRRTALKLRNDSTNTADMLDKILYKHTRHHLKPKHLNLQILK